ncbi:MAG: SulP family inorganic anion transporter, partial [Candidatus Sumerlaeota bacterium]
IPAYVRKDLLNDTTAGMTVAVMSIPQSMAYAMIVQVPPIYGLYTSVVGGILGAIFGSSRHLVTGPTNASCMVIASLMLPYLDEPNKLEIVFLLTFLTGVVKLLFGVLRLGGVVRYVSNSVVVGFTAGAGLLIAANQLQNVIGVKLDGNPQLMYRVLIETVKKLPDTNWLAVTLALLTASIMIISRKISHRIPGALLGMGIATALVYLLKLHEASSPVQIVRDLSRGGEIDRSLMIGHFPEYLRPGGWKQGFGIAASMASGVVALAILGLIEAASSSRAVAAASGQRLDFSREFMAQGISNIGGAFFQNFPGSGSFVRTALNYQSGGRTRMSAVFSAVATALAILLLAPVANFIPTASLAGLLIIIAYSMVQKHRLLLAMRTSRNSCIVLLTTFAATMVLPLQYAIFVGIFVSIAFLLQITSKTELTVLQRRGDGLYDQMPLEESTPHPIQLVNMEGDLYFAAVENLDYALQSVVTEKTRVVVLRMKRLRAVGSTAMAVLETFYQALDKQNLWLVVCGIEPKLEDLLTRSGLRAKIGEQNLFFADNTLFRSTELAMARARAILDMEELREKAETPGRLATGMPIVPAHEIMSRQCIRFGENHSIREAVWLMSGMYKRRASHETLPLYLQDQEGRLSGALTPWQLLEALSESVGPDEARSLNDKELGARYRRNFEKSVITFMQRDMKPCTPDTPLGKLIEARMQTDNGTVPILDSNGRLIGMVGAGELMTGLGKAFHIQDNDEKETLPQTLPEKEL